MHSGSHVSVRGGHDPQQKICCLKSLSPFELIQTPQPTIFSELQDFLRVLQHPLSCVPSIYNYRFMGMIQLYKKGTSLSCEPQTSHCRILYVCTSRMLAWKLKDVSVMYREPSDVVGRIHCKEPWQNLL